MNFEPNQPKVTLRSPFTFQWIVLSFMSCFFLLQFLFLSTTSPHLLWGSFQPPFSFSSLCFCVSSFTIFLPLISVCFLFSNFVSFLFVFLLFRSLFRSNIISDHAEDKIPQEVQQTVEDQNDDEEEIRMVAGKASEMAPGFLEFLFHYY